jgi:hypothetical protein
MRTYDVYRHDELVARVRILDNGSIEWAYRPVHGDWQGFWWANETKALIELLIERVPPGRQLMVSEFWIRRRT